MMRPAQKRFWLIIAFLTGLALAATLIFYGLRTSVSYFYAPKDVAAELQKPKPRLEMGRVFRLGGLVKEGSIEKKQTADGTRIDFVITDLKDEIAVSYEGILPDLFREGQGAIATGVLVNEKQFVASELLAKHDENYMPPEVKDALERAEENNAAP
jgi:cytochrome c-type biogenesis protein CcmE